MLWRRYRSTIAWALLLAAGTGSLLGLAVYAGGNPGYREQAGAAGLLYWLALGAVLGVATALAALVGGAVALLIRDRSLARPAPARVVAGSVGAGAGAAALWLGAGTVNAAVTELGASFLGLAILIALVAAAVAAALAAFLLRRAERRAGGGAAAG